MKCCVYCGQANPEEATHCQKCGAGFNQKQGAEGAVDSPQPGRLERVGALDSEVQANLVDSVLSQRAIPHVMQSYHDSALDGLFQAQKGWGAVLAPAEFKEEILEIIEDAKNDPAAPPTPETEPDAPRR
jgi:hypothetical protein